MNSFQRTMLRQDDPEKCSSGQTVRGRNATILFLAVVVKAVLLFGLLQYFLSHSPQDYAAERFPDGYDQIAWNLVQGNGYRVFPDTSLTMLRSPGFVLVLALIFNVFGKSLIAVQIVNLVFSTATAVLTQVLARKAGLSRTAATIAALLFFFHPGVVVADSRGGVESVLAFCLVSSVLLAVIALERQEWSRFAAAGVANGLAFLVKSSVAPVLPALFLYAMWKSPDRTVRRKILTGTMICGLATVLVVTPWIVRNYYVSGEFVPTMTVTGLTVFQGEYVIEHLNSNLENFEVLNHAADEQLAIANAMGLKTKGPFFPQFFAVADEVSFYRELGRRALNNYRREPKLVVRGIVHNIGAFWVGGRTRRATMVNSILALPLLTLSGIGLVAGIKRRLGVFQFLLVILVFMMPHLLILAMARYYIPLVPFVVLLAAIPLANVLDRFALERGLLRHLPICIRPQETMQSPPLFVDLDGTLIKTDLLVESCIELLKRRPLLALKAPFWLLRGKAHLKDRIAEAIELDPTLLPYHPEMLSYLRTQRERGREVYLATASSHRYADSIARYLGVFDGVLASDGRNNLSAERKLEAIRAFHSGGFVYAGNDWADMPIWEAAEGAILVNVPKALAEQVSRVKPVEALFPIPESGLGPLLKAIRPHQWLKNLLVFLPLLPIATAAKGNMLWKAVLAFAAFSLCASAVYLVNDLSDLAADRIHPRKRERPFAAGTVAPLHGAMLAPVLLALAFALTLLLPWHFAVVLAVYWMGTSAYTFFLKRRVLVDVLVLAGLYTVRVLGGAAAIAVAPSFWILAFSMFIFFSLALTKRYAELRARRTLNPREDNGRGYCFDDLQLVQLMGVTSGYMSVLVMALYINSPEILARYQHVQLLWGVCPLLILWVSRVWLKASRGEMTDDPLVFAAKDRGSRYVVALAVGLVIAALL